MLGDDKKYSLYKALQTRTDLKVPEEFSAFKDSLKNPDFVQQSWNAFRWLGYEESSLNFNEFNNYLNTDISYDDGEVTIKPETTPEDIPFYQDITGSGIRVLSEIGEGLNDFAISLDQGLKGNTIQLGKAGQDIAELPKQLTTLLPAVLYNTAIAYTELGTLTTDVISEANQFLFGESEETQKLVEAIHTTGDKIVKSSLEKYARDTENIGQFYKDIGFTKDEPTKAGEIFGSFGFTGGIIALSAINPAFGFYAGMTMNGMELAKDIYEETGDLDDAKIGFLFGNLSGATEAFGPLEAISFVKQGAKRLLGKNIEKAFMRSFLRETGKLFSIESTQEGFQNVVEQVTKQEVGAQEDFSWEEFWNNFLIGGISGMIMGGGVSIINRVKLEEGRDKFVKTAKDEVDDLEKRGIITEEEATKSKAEFDKLSERKAFDKYIADVKARQKEQFEDKKNASETGKKLADEVPKFFTVSESSGDLIRQSEVIADIEKRGTPLNPLSRFLIGKMIASEQIDEFEDEEVLEQYTDAILRRVNQTPEFQEVRSSLQTEELVGEALTRATQEEILNTNKFPELQKAYENHLIAGAEVLTSFKKNKEEAEAEIEFEPIAANDEILEEDTQETIEEAAPKEEEKLFVRSRGRQAFDDFEQPKLKSFIKGINKKFAGAVGQTQEVRNADAIAVYNERQESLGEPKRLRRELVKKGETSQYKIIEYEAEVSVQTKLFQKGTSTTPTSGTIAPLDTPLRAIEEVKRLDGKGYADPVMKLMVDWLSDQFGDITITYDNNAKEPGEFRWKAETGDKSITVNPTHSDIQTGKDLYKTIAHELLHNATFELLKKDPIFRKHMNQLYDQIKDKIIGTEYYEEHKEDLDRIFNAGQHQVDEFVSHALASTSVIREWMQNNYITPNTPFLKRFLRYIFDAFSKLFNKVPNRINYLQGLETLLNQAIGLPTQTIQEIGIDLLYDETVAEKYDIEDRVDKALALSDEVLGDMRSMSSFMDALNLDVGTDAYAYVQGLNRKQFDDLLKNSPRLLQKMEVVYDEKFKNKMTFDEYKRIAGVFAYNNIKSVKKRRTGILDNTGVTPEIKLIEGTHTTLNGDELSPYSSYTMLDEFVEDLNSLFGVEFEVIYLKEIIESTFTGRKSFSPSKLFDLNNEEMKDLYAQTGIIFPGTWADKSTTIGLMPSEALSGDAFIALQTMYNQKMQALVESGVVSQEYLEEAPITNADIMRLVLEDFKLGGKVLNGTMQSALFNPEYDDTYDAIKMFKRPYLVAPKFFFEQLPEEVNFIVDKVVKEVFNGNIKESGIVIRDGKINFRSVIFNDLPGVDENGFRNPLEVEIDGKIYDLNKILVDDYGNPVTDGGLLYGLGGVNQVLNYMTGAIKTGALKFWGGNNKEGNFSDPFFLKTAGHGYSQKDAIVRWMRANNIAMLIPSSSVKINRYGVEEVSFADGVAHQGEVIEIPIENLYRIQEKDEAGRTARGMQQTITTNFISALGNEAYRAADPKGEFWPLMRNFTDNIIQRFTDKMAIVDPEGLMKYVKDVIEKPTNKYHRGLAEILTNLLYTYAEQRVDELSAEENIDKELMREALRDKRLSNLSLADKFSGLFYQPYFNQLFQDFMHLTLKELLFYDIPGTYSVNTPDIGALANSRVELASKTAMNQVKRSLEQEIANVYFGVQQPREKEIDALTAEIKALEDKLASKVVIAGKDIKTLTEKAIKRKREQIKKIETAIKEPRKITEGFIRDDKVVIDGRNPKVQEQRDKLLNQWLNSSSKRIQGDYAYITADTAREHNIKLGDTTINGVVPSDSAQSFSGATVIGIMSTDISESNKFVGSSEYYVTQLGKDHDFDTILVIPYSKLYGTRVEFQKLADIFRETKDNYPAYILKTMKKVLNEPNLRIADIYNKQIRLRYMQAMASAVAPVDTYNPLYNQDILDRYKKEVGIPVNKRKMATFKSLVDFKTKFVMFNRVFEIDANREGIDKTHVFHLIETNAKVDMPGDDTALKYKLDITKEFDIENGTDLTGIIAAEQDETQRKIKAALIPQYTKMFKALDKFLFGYGVKLSTKNNLDDFNDVRALKDSVKFMRIQKRINDLLTTAEGKEKLFREFEKTFLQHNSKYAEVVNVNGKKHLKAKGAGYYMMEAAQQYMENMRLKDLNESMPMYMTENTDLTVIPNMLLDDGEYVKTEHKTIRELAKLVPAIDKALKDTQKSAIESKEVPVKAQWEAAKTQDQKIDKLLFWLTRDNKELHLLKGKILRLANMFVSGRGVFKPQYGLTRFANDLEVAVDDVIFDDVFTALLNKEQIKIRVGSGSATKVDLNYNSKRMTVEVEGNRIKFTVNGISAYADEIPILIKAGDPLGKAFERYFEGAFKSGVNRGEIGKVIDFRGTLLNEDRWGLISELVVPEYKGLSTDNKQILLTSLLSYNDGKDVTGRYNPQEASETIYNSNRKTGRITNDRLFSILGLFNDQASMQWMEKYAEAFTGSIPTPGFTKSVAQTKAAEVDDAGWEIWNLKSPKRADLQKNLIDYVIEEEKNKESFVYTNPDRIVGRVVNFVTGIIQNFTIREVGIVNEPYSPSKVLPKGDVAVLHSLLDTHRTSVGGINQFYITTDTEISKMEQQLFEFGDIRGPQVLKSIELQKIREEVTDLVEENPLGIEIEKIESGYAYTYDGVVYLDVDGLLTAAGIAEGKQRLKHKMAIKWHIAYSVENIQFIDSMIDYLSGALFEFGSNSMAIETVNSMLRRYKKLKIQMTQRRFHYHPRVYKQHIFETKILNYLKALEAERITDEITTAAQYIEQHPDAVIPDAIRSLANRSGNQNWILKTAKERVEKERFNIGIGTYGKYINAFSLRRDLPDEINGIKYYIRDSIVPHQRHQAQMQRMLRNDVTFVNYLQYEHNAILNGTDQEIIEKVKTKVAASYGNKFLLSREVSPDEVSPGMEISFYHIDNRYINGIVDRVDDQYIYLKLDRDRTEKYLRVKVIEYEELDRQIQANPSVREPTIKQLATLQDLADQGYIEIGQVMNITSGHEASTVILRILKRMLDNPDNWGKYKKNNVFRKTANPTGDAQGTSGVYRYLEFGSIDYLMGIARELDNTYDGLLSTTGFGEIVKSDKLLPYLKYTALQLPYKLLGAASKGLSLMGLSTPSAGVKNRYDGMAGVIRDTGWIGITSNLRHGNVRGIEKEIRAELETGNVAVESEALMKTVEDGLESFADKAKATAAISKEVMLEQGFFQEDFLMRTVAGTFEELFTDDEKQQVAYKQREKIFQLYKTIMDSWGFKEYRDKLTELEKQLYESVNIVDHFRIQDEIDVLNRDWNEKHSARMTEVESTIKKHKFLFGSKEIDPELLKVNLADIHNLSTAKLILLMGKVVTNLSFLTKLFGTKTFASAEGHNRRMATVNYVWREIERGETDPELIKLAALKGIARSQAMYDTLNRRLGDNTSLGRFMLMFGQYPYFMRQVHKRTRMQAKKEERPELRNKLIWEWMRDTQLSAANYFIQGLRFGSPVNMTINSILLVAIQALKRLDDDKDPIDWADWDVREMFFNILQFKIGMGIGLIAGTAWNLATGQDKLISIGRIGRAIEIVFSFFFTDKSRELNKKYQEKKDLGNISRWLIGFNPFFPGVSRKMDKDLYEHYQKPLLPESIAPKDIFDSKLGDYLLTPIPWHNQWKYGTGR